MYYVIKAGLHRIEPPKLLRDRFSHLYRGLDFPPNHFLFENFDRKLQHYIEADLINYNTRSYYEEFFPEKFETFKEPFAVLTLGELEAGFVVCLVPLVLSVFVFFIEWLSIVKDLIVFSIIFEKFFELKKLDPWV